MQGVLWHYSSVAASSRCTEPCNRGIALSSWSAVGQEGNLHRTEPAPLAEFSVNVMVVMCLYTQSWQVDSVKVSVFLKIVYFIFHFIPFQNCFCLGEEVRNIICCTFLRPKMLANEGQFLFNPARKAYSV
jgi:hypothetical protein